jgi:hypothetical protein
MTTKIAILGSGAVGQTLSMGFVQRGHDVRMGTRDPGSAKIREWVGKVGGKASAGTFAEAAVFGEIAVLATKWDGTEEALRLAGPANLAGKVVLDATNPLGFTPERGLHLAIAGSDSGGEQVQRWLPGARVVKAYNTVGADHMVDPVFPGGPPDMFLCGNDAAAKETAAGICRAFGWGAIDLGGLEMARLLEPLALVWILHAIRSGSRDHAFKLLRK